LFFRAGLEWLFFFAGVAYPFAWPSGLDLLYSWTRGWAMVLALIDRACLVVCLLWAAAVLVIGAMAP
jgi:hypothetical protein